jgi:hypothetical protein
MTEVNYCESCGAHLHPDALVAAAAPLPDAGTIAVPEPEPTVESAPRAAPFLPVLTFRPAGPAPVIPWAPPVAPAAMATGAGRPSWLVPCWSAPRSAPSSSRSSRLAGDDTTSKVILRTPPTGAGGAVTPAALTGSIGSVPEKAITGAPLPSTQ